MSKQTVENLVIELTQSLQELWNQSKLSPNFITFLCFQTENWAENVLKAYELSGKEETEDSTINLYSALKAAAEHYLNQSRGWQGYDCGKAVLVAARAMDLALSYEQGNSGNL